MPALKTNSDGTSIYLALEDGSGNQVIAKSLRTDLSTWTGAYSPGAGSAGNVESDFSDINSMYFYGNFGTDLLIQKFNISAGTVSDISPASLAAKVANTLSLNPGDSLEFSVSIDTDEDLKNTVDGGTNYTTLDASLGFDATALWMLWSGRHFDHRYFVAGEVSGGNLDLLYSPNEGATSNNEEGATLGALGEISNVEATEQADVQERGRIN